MNKLNFVSFDFILNVTERVDIIFWNNEGYYDFTKNKTICYSVPMHRWATGPMMLALSLLVYETKKLCNETLYLPKQNSYRQLVTGLKKNYLLHAMFKNVNVSRHIEINCIEDHFRNDS